MNEKNTFETFLASLASCLNITARFIAKTKGITICSIEFLNLSASLDIKGFIGIKGTPKNMFE